MDTAHLHSRYAGYVGPVFLRWRSHRDHTGTLRNGRVQVIDRKAEHKHKIDQRKARYNEMAAQRQAEQQKLFDGTLLWDGDQYTGDKSNPDASVKGLKMFLLGTSGATV